MHINTVSTNSGVATGEEIANALRINQQIQDPKSLGSGIGQPPIILIDKETYSILNRDNSKLSEILPDAFATSWGTEADDQIKMQILERLEEAHRLRMDPLNPQDAATQIQNRANVNPRHSCP